METLDISLHIHNCYRVNYSIPSANEKRMNGILLETQNIDRYVFENED